MALVEDSALSTDYDDEANVLYASVGPLRHALCAEISPDILLRYVPPHCAVVGVTVVNFLRHFPPRLPVPFEAHARAVVAEILEKHPQVPRD